MPISLLFDWNANKINRQQNKKKPKNVDLSMIKFCKRQVSWICHDLLCTSFYNKLDLNLTDTEIISCRVQTCNRHQCICQRMVICMSPIIKPYDPIIINYHYLIPECLMNDYSAIWM